MTKYFFSIIIPFYNKEKSLEYCINSLLCQDFPKDDYEIIAVNNNSTDKSLAIINRHPSIKLCHEKQQGAYAARNTGILNSNGSIIVFTDADAQVKPNWLSNIHYSIAKNNYAVLIGWYSAARQIKSIEMYNLFISERIKTAIYRKNSFMLTACGANLAVKKEVFDKEGLFISNSNSEDVYFAIRCMQKGYNIGFDDKIAVKRNDIDSIGMTLLKNFIYGCSNAVDIRYRFPLSKKIESICFTSKFVLQHLPVSLGIFLFSYSYLMGHLIGRLKLLNSKNLLKFVNHYTEFISKKAI